MQRAESMTGQATLSYPHLVDRLAINVARPYSDFCRQYEDAVPPLDPAHLAALVKRHTPWAEVLADARASAPRNFFIFWKMDAAPMMKLAGHDSSCTTYLMGNYTIAERMFRYDPAVMLYAPLRTAIYVDAENQTRFLIDRPSSLFSSFANQDIADVGVELDAHVAALLVALGVPAPGELRRSWEEA